MCRQEVAAAAGELEVEKQVRINGVLKFLLLSLSLSCFIALYERLMWLNESDKSMPSRPLARLEILYLLAWTHSLLLDGNSLIEGPLVSKSTR